MMRLLVLILLIADTGCSFAPRDRLTFPTHPIERSADAEWFDVDRDGRRDFAIQRVGDDVQSLLYDDDQDGTVDRVYHLADYDERTLPHVVILLDSIPWQVMADRYAAGDFRWFRPPVKTIAAFPSLTEICYSEAFHAPPLPGVIDAQYDSRRRKHRDGLWKRAIDKAEQPWERRLHYHASYAEHGLSFLDPRAWYAGELARAYRAIEASPDRVTYAYFASAAGMVCRYGRPGAEEVLDGARQLCLQLLHERRGAVRISMMADHGHNLVPTKNVDLAAMLKGEGFRVVRRIKRDDDVAVSVTGLVTNAALHTRRPRAVADALVKHEAVELVMYREGDRVIVQSAQGRAAVSGRGDRTRYDPINADVLKLGSLAGQERSEREWFEATLDHEYPNAPPRVWAAMGRLVIDTPTLLICVRDGYAMGDLSLEKWIDMQSTHGGLNQVNSATFVMSMTNRLSAPLLPREVLPVLEPGNPPRVLR